jgi:hypothetical protein
MPRVRRMLAALALLSGVMGASIPACEDDSVFRSGDPPPSIGGPDSGTSDGGAADTGGGGGAPGDPDAGND